MIGVFDSGLGGLSVLRALRDLMPNQKFYYLADSAKAPYGEKSAEFIIERCHAIIKYFDHYHPSAIVVACNTATAQAIDNLRQHYTQFPFIGVEPGIKPAGEASKNGVIGVLATKSTLQSQRYKKLLSEYAPNHKIIEIIGTGLVEQIEQGYLYAPKTYDLCDKYCQEFLNHNIDVLVLGCTHYSFLLPVIKKYIPEHVTIIDTAPAVAQQCAKILNQPQYFSSTPLPTEFFTTGNGAQMNQLLHLLRVYDPVINEITI